jgi:hypothetical protein
MLLSAVQLLIWRQMKPDLQQGLFFVFQGVMCDCVGTDSFILKASYMKTPQPQLQPFISSICCHQPGMHDGGS